MTRRTVLIPALVAGAVLACVAAVLAVPAKEAEAAFPGENGKLVFSYLVSYDSDPSGIFAVNPDGTERTDLARAPFGYRDENPAVSPDGGRVVFNRYSPYSETPDDDIYSVGMDGTGLENLTDSPSASEGAPAWSPDGSKIAFPSGGALWTMGPDGSEKRRIADGSFEALAWSPDGSKIAFTRGGDIHTMNADGSGIVRLTDDPAADRSPDWSPDGSEIAFDSQRDGKPGIYVMNADGSDERKLPIDTTYPPSENEELVFVGDRDPAWSPDGTKIAFSRVTDHYGDSFAYDEYSIRTVDADGTGPLGTYGRARYDAHPSWGPLNAGTPEPTDGTAPTINALRPAPGSSTRDRTPTIRAAVRDAASELAASGIRLYVDGAPRAFSYDPDTDRLSRTTGKLSYGRHSVRVVAEDGAGNAASRAWSFRVVRGR